MLLKEFHFYCFKDDNDDNYSNHQQSSQLQVLYEARGRKIESLQIDLAEKEENYSKELRILNHKLVLATGSFRCYEFILAIPL